MNAIASVPGLLTFDEPKAQTKNFAPRVGIVYAPNFETGLLHRIFGTSDQSSIRASFAMAYDTIVDNVHSVQSRWELCFSDEERIVGYLATNPNAQYVQAGLGALSNIGRNTLQLPAIKNLDFSIFKNFAIGEGSKKFQLRADFYNAFNHPQYVPGSIDGVEPITTTGVNQINTVGQADFNVPSHVCSSHPRVIQLALRFNF